MIADEYHGNGKLLLVRSEELGMRSEEWWKGRTAYKAPQYPFYIKYILCDASKFYAPPPSFLIPNCIYPSIYVNEIGVSKNNLFILDFH